MFSGLSMGACGLSVGVDYQWDGAVKCEWEGLLN